MIPERCASTCTAAIVNGAAALDTLATPSAAMYGEQPCVVIDEVQ